MLGRAISAEDDAPNGPQVALLGYPLWQGRYAGDPSVVGRTMMINDVPVEVIGVMPEGFRLPTDFTSDAAEPTQLWRPIQWDPASLQRGNHGYFAAATLAPGQTAATATAELQAIATRLTEQGAYPPAMKFSAFAVSLDEEIRGGVRPAMWLLMGAVGFLLLIACANVANLLLVRGDARVREMALRTAIGAAPDRLVRQLLVESVVLAVIGAVLGLGLAAAALRTLIALDPTSLPPLAPVTLDLTVGAVHTGAWRCHDHRVRVGAGAAHLAHEPGRLATRRYAAGYCQRLAPAHAQRVGGGGGGAGCDPRGWRGPDDPQPVGAGPHRPGLQSRPHADHAAVDSGRANTTRRRRS